MIQFTDKVQLIRTLTFIVVFKQFKFIFAFEIGQFWAKNFHFPLCSQYQIICKYLQISIFQNKVTQEPFDTQEKFY